MILPRELNLRWLQTLDLSGCEQLSELWLSADLRSLQTLDLSGCRQLSGDLAPLTSLTSLQSLNLNGCRGFRLFAPLQSLLPTLKELSLFGCKFDDLPSEVRGEEDRQNVLAKVRSHYGQAEPPKVFVSYAWGDTSSIASEEDRQRQEVVERLCQTLERESWQVVRDKNKIKYGDSVHDFMKNLGQSNLVIVVLSAKYLHSPYCITELYDIYQSSRGEKEDFLRRIIPLALADARIGAWRDRVEYAKHWEAEFKAMEHEFIHLGEVDLGLYKAMKRWHNEVGDMLAYVNDVLVPHGFDDIVKGDFASLRQMLSRRIDT